MDETLAELHQIPNAAQPTPGQGLVLGLAGKLPAGVLQSGIAIVTWAGASTASGVTVVNHGLGTVPAIVIATVNVTSGGVPVIPVLRTFNYTATTFSVIAQEPDNVSIPAAGQTATLIWVAS